MRKFALLAILAGLCIPCFPQKTFYFPHFGDGGGLSTLFVITNPSATAATGTITFYDPAGSLQSVPLISGSISSLPLSLAPHSSARFETRGTSNPVKSGYVQVQVSSGDVGGVAIFKFQNGMEASVLPVTAVRSFWVYVERSAGIDTGIAMCRSGSNPVNLTLFNSGGSQVASGTIPVAGKQGARFLGEIFASLPQTFTGHLLLESTADFSAIGLRFGGSVLSTLPSVPLGTGPAAGQNLEVDPNGLKIVQSSSYLSVTGIVINHDVSDAVWIEVAISAFGADGRMVGGDTTYIHGTNRKLSSVFTNTCLRPTEKGYFDAYFPISGTASRIETMAVAEVRKTDPPLSNLEVTSHSISSDSYGYATVTGIAKNTGTRALESATLDVVYLNSQNRVLDIGLEFPAQRNLQAGQTTSFSHDSVIKRSDVGSVVFKGQWDDSSLSAVKLPPSTEAGTTAARREIIRRLQLLERSSHVEVQIVASPIMASECPAGGEME